MIGITNDAECAMEHPRESRSTTTTILIERGMCEGTAILDLDSPRRYDIFDFVEVPYGARGRFEITVTFTPEETDGN